MTLFRFTFLILISFLLMNCDSDPTNTGADGKTTEPVVDSGPPKDLRKDYHSYARPLEARTQHLELELDVDFENRILTGKASWEILNNKAKALFLDVRDLEIQKVTLGREETETTFDLGKSRKFLGQALKIDIEPNTQLVNVYYKTTPQSAALDWLEPRQTADKKHPFLFTQGQAILTRTWIPCQDSPGIRITYDAKVTVPKELMAVMSASNPEAKNDTGVYTFSMPQPIPPYLIALAAGDLEFAPIGPRTGVYAEPSMVAASKNEFADMEKMLVAAEELYGTYLWERYDVIVLPPSFPFGGMENPRLTFATPTIIAGDRSLTALIAHELAHSWSGNLVTNATWNDFWLNEGFTVYFERRIMESLYGKEYTDMLAELGYQDLEADVNDLGPNSADTHLKLDLTGRDPDDGMTDIAYEKGAFFLMMLEEEAGRENFDNFLKTYFDQHKFQTLTTDEFIQYLNQNLIDKYALQVNIDEWIFGPGIPATAPKVVSARFQQVDAQVKAMIAGKSPQALETSKWTTHEWLHFLRALPKDLSKDQMGGLDQAFGFSKSGNSEILAAWFELSIYNKENYSEAILPEITAFLT